VETSVSRRELREEDLNLGQPRFGNPFCGENAVLTNTAVNIAVVIGGGSDMQVINRSNVV